MTFSYYLGSIWTWNTSLLYLFDGDLAHALFIFFNILFHILFVFQADDDT